MRRLFFCLLLCISTINSSYAIKPEKKYAAKPADYGFVSETKQLKTPDAAIIMVWHLPAQGENKKNTSIIISNGHGGNMSNWLIVAGNLAYLGFDTWLYDYRGFGESSDFAIESNMLYYEAFVKDLSTVVELVKSSEPKNKICLMGYSMGSIINMLYISKNATKVDFCISEGHVYSPKTVADRLNAAGKNIILPNPINFKIEDWDTFYKQLKLPMLLFCASDDIVCTPNDIIKLEKEVDNIQIIHFKGGHLQGFSALQGDYFQKIDDFLKNYKFIFAK